ncbi:hypothetical protein QCA50_009372 [Cerrena zonata]|uniref:Uncharacterized protein n=1 Tax=Cerrena zonata TaxID=2478898 RepID=A0AAW0G1X3_9APHY
MRLRGSSKFIPSSAISQMLWFYCIQFFKSWADADDTKKSDPPSADETCEDSCSDPGVYDFLSSSGNASRDLVNPESGTPIVEIHENFQIQLEI